MLIAGDLESRANVCTVPPLLARGARAGARGVAAVPVRSVAVGVKPVIPSAIPMTLPPSVVTWPAISGPLPLETVFPATIESVSVIPPWLWIAPPWVGPEAFARLLEKVLPVIVIVLVLLIAPPKPLIVVLPEKVLLMMVIVLVEPLAIAPPLPPEVLPEKVQAVM